MVYPAPMINALKLRVQFWCGDVLTACDMSATHVSPATHAIRATSKRYVSSDRVDHALADGIAPLQDESLR